MGDLRDFQSAFVRELLCPEQTAQRSALFQQPGFAVYRNTVLAGCIAALAANYPTVHQLVGADCFASAARAFALQTPPRSGVLGYYGDGFALFLASFDGVSQLEYLPAVAALDRFWTESHFAADAPVLHAVDLACLTPEQLSLARLLPHPAARWRAFEKMPVYTLWRRHRELLPLDDELVWKGEAALLARPTGSVVWTQLSADTASFMDSCAAGQTFAEAMGTADANGASGDVASWLPRLIRAGAFTQLVGRWE